MIAISLGFKGTGSRFQDILANLDALDGHLMIGVPTGLRAPSRKVGNIEMWKLAWILEYGNPSNKLFGNNAPIPPRPVLTQLWANNAITYLRGAKIHAGRAAKGKDSAAGMNNLGKRITRDIRRAYEECSGPALKEFTLRNRQGDSPLTHTRALARAWRSAWVPSQTKTLERMGRQLDRIIRQMQAASTPGSLSPFSPNSNVPKSGGLPAGPRTSRGPSTWRHA